MLLSPGRIGSIGRTATPIKGGGVVDPPDEEVSYFTATPASVPTDEDALAGAEFSTLAAYFLPIPTTATANENTLASAEILVLEA